MHATPDPAPLADSPADDFSDPESQRVLDAAVTLLVETLATEAADDYCDRLWGA